MKEIINDEKAKREQIIQESRETGFKDMEALDEDHK